jgi:transposase
VLRALIHHANLAREQGRNVINADIRDQSVTRFRHGVLIGLSDTTRTRPNAIYGPARSNRTSPAG